jgi:tight adherence protein C
VSIDLLVVTIAIFTGVAVVTAYVTENILERRTPEYQRVRRVLSSSEAAIAVPGGTRLSLDESTESWLRVERRLPKSAKEMSRLRRRFALAGHRWAGGPAVLVITELVAPVILGGLPLVLIGRTPFGWLTAGVGAVLGFMGPGLWLDWKVEARKMRIRDALPDTLDLLVVCLEAGSSVDQAIVKSTGELEIAYPDIAEELRTIMTEVRAGKSRNEAFKGFAQRTKLDEARALATMLVQTERFGTSVAQALRAHADSVRTQRRQRAEERAAKIAVKLVFPLVIFLFPALYVVLLGPAVLEVIRAFE